MKVKFLPTGKEIEIAPERTLLQAALENGVEIRSICKGKLNCAECRVKIVEGESNVLPPSKAELNLLGSAWQLDSRRFACQVRCFGDIVVDLTEQIQRAETARKNIRGFKSSRPITESTAVIDTMILNEKIESGRDDDGAGPDPTEGGDAGADGGGTREPRERRESKQNRGRRDGGQNPRGGGGDGGGGGKPQGEGGGGRSRRGGRRGRRGGGGGGGKPPGGGGGKPPGEKS